MLSTATQKQSEYTAAIALETRRDSAAMKTISVVTIVFLPGTFVATLFSMDVFHGQSADGTGVRVASLFWVYWAVTIPLTMLVIASWLLWSRRYFEKWKGVESIRDLEMKSLPENERND